MDQRITLDDYPYEIPDSWEADQFARGHLVYKNHEEDYAIEFMRYAEKFAVSSNIPLLSPDMVPGTMKVVEEHEYDLDDLEGAFDKINEYLTENTVRLSEQNC